MDQMLSVFHFFIAAWVSKLTHFRWLLIKYFLGVRVLGIRSLTLNDLLISLGLSSYAEDPKSAAKSISKLLQTAKEHIPQEQWAHTPITLKATAGKLTSTWGISHHNGRHQS